MVTSQTEKNKVHEKLYTKFSINHIVVNEPIRLNGIENDLITSTHILCTCRMFAHSMTKGNGDREMIMAV